ncbi:methyltransferase family protein [Novosphingobium sp. PhB55]|uniref:class I SAM-dependent methyltransferase n=1 Tax=Novosphingobium sp. PhB55 TaxID=2485106 RepID=UPI001065190F|nr:class I SAM-dependent methyltransferase [Novosphingobium sp. PhB55]TDW59225.1 methyltransferase family protein [Novosphingobium sp. PhB55]
MHDTALEIGRLAIEIYADSPKPRILEIGALDVNGSLRQFAPDHGTYVGVDLSEGKSVDVVVEPGEPLPFDEKSFDLVIASSVFEHDPAFWMTFLELIKVVREGGYLYINAPSNGKVHRYPEDHWRFYPDSGHALQRWAKSQNYDVTLVESFTAPRVGDMWNDFVAVFRRSGSDVSLPAKRLHTQFVGTNVWIPGERSPRNPKDFTEDMELLAAAEEKLETLKVQISDSEAVSGKAAADRQARIAILESTLRQREEEIEQTRSELANVGAKAQKLEILQNRLDDANSWVFQLAGERRLAQQNAERQTRRADELASKLRSHETLGRQIKRLRASISELEGIRQEQAEKISSDKFEIDGLQNALNQSRAEQKKLADSLDAAEVSISKRFEEVAALIKLLDKAEQSHLLETEHRKWLAEVIMVLSRRPFWWAFMSPSWVQRQQQRSLRAHALFDAEAYLKLYPDVAAERVNPVHHYILHGMQEGRKLVR